jgi:hypothetical protein
VDQVIAANGCQVTIPAEDRGHQFWLGQLHPDRKWDRTAMGRVVRVDIHIPGYPSRATNSGDHNVLVSWNT